MRFCCENPLIPIKRVRINGIDFMLQNPPNPVGEFYCTVF
jgi:hypothetical protein